MKNSDGAYIQAYNAQAVVDDAHQIITAADVTTNPSDALNYTGMLDQSAANTGIHAKQALVDAGYCSEANLQAAAARKAEHGTDTFMATGRLAHDEQVRAAPRGRIPADATPRERMARKLRTKPGGRLRPPQSHRRTRIRADHDLPDTAGNSCCAAKTEPAANGGSWPPATTSARSSGTPEPPGWPPPATDERTVSACLDPGWPATTSRKPTCGHEHATRANATGYAHHDHPQACPFPTHAPRPRTEGSGRRPEPSAITSTVTGAVRAGDCCDAQFAGCLVGVLVPWVLAVPVAVCPQRNCVVLHRCQIVAARPRIR